MKKITIILLLILIKWNVNYSQQKFTSNIIPPAPDASSLGKYGNIPVSLFNGIPSVNIPLFNIKEGEVEVPISLDYHSGGIQVSEVPSWVGLGWSLSAGGVITRTVRGLPDDVSNGFIKSGQSRLPAYPNVNNQLNDDFFYNVYEGGNDLEPDIFFYNFCGISGKFVFDPDGKVHLTEFKSLKIVFDPLLRVFTITNDKGIKYLFTQTEISNVTTSTQTNGSSSTSLGYDSYISSWYLKEIQFPYSSRKIEFFYNNFYLQYELPSSEIRYKRFNLNAMPVHPLEYSKVKQLFTLNQALRLSKITFSEGEIVFNAGNYRSDLKGSKCLDNIKLINKNSSTVKQFKFRYGYFDATSFRLDYYQNANENTPSNTQLRLGLYSVQELDETGELNAPYTFDYEKQMLPDRLYSNAQDHWGYYNGYTTNTTLIPFEQGDDNQSQYGIRSPRSEFAVACMLNKITYPTGGNTSFIYELNKIFSTDGHSDIFIRTEHEAKTFACHVLNIEFIINSKDNTSDVYIERSAGIPNDYLVTCGNTTDFPCYQCNRQLFFKIYNDRAEEVWSEVVGIGANSSQYTFHINLPNGHYYGKFMSHNRDGSWTEARDTDASFYGLYSYNITCIYKKSDAGLPKQVDVGGLRIKEMTDYDPLSKQGNKKIYDYSADDGNSSGVISYFPIYTYTTAIGEIHHKQCSECSFGGCKYTEYAPNMYAVRGSSTNVPLTNINGGIVGYQKVTVFYNENGLTKGINGKTENFYTIKNAVFNHDIVDVGYALADEVCSFKFDPGPTPVFPFAPAISYDWMNGLLKRSIDYRYTNDLNKPFIKTREIINTYKDDYLSNSVGYESNDVIGAKIGLAYRWEHYCEISSSPMQGNGRSDYGLAVQFYIIPCRLSAIVKTEEFNYSYDGNTSTKVVKEFYNRLNLSANTFILSRVDELQHDKVFKTQYLYPIDYEQLTGFIKDMKDAYIHSNPIEIVNYQTDLDGRGNVKILSGTILKYSGGTSPGKLEQQWQWETVKPLALAGFKFSNQEIGVLPFESANKTFDDDSNYRLMYSYQHDEKGNIKNVSKENDINACYIWGYNQSYPIAKFENIDYSTVSSNQSLMSYVNQLQNFTNTIGPSEVSSLNALNKNIRDLAPVNVMVSTYTYKPLVGITSQTDANGFTTYYEYDTYGRLKCIKDNEGNIVKAFNYHYKESN